MSLFFLGFTLLTYSACRYQALTAKPVVPTQRFVKAALFKGTPAQFEDLLDEWIERTAGLHWHSKDNGKLVVEEKGDWFSYGYFYHFDLSPDADGLEVLIQVQAKLIATGQSSNAHSQLMESLKKHEPAA